MQRPNTLHYCLLPRDRLAAHFGFSRVDVDSFPTMSRKCDCPTFALKLSSWTDLARAQQQGHSQHSDMVWFFTKSSNSSIASDSSSQLSRNAVSLDIPRDEGQTNSRRSSFQFLRPKKSTSHWDRESEGLELQEQPSSRRESKVHLATDPADSGVVIEEEEIPAVASTQSTAPQSNDQTAPDAKAASKWMKLPGRKRGDSAVSLASFGRKKSQG